MAFHDDYFFTNEEKWQFQNDINSVRYYDSLWNRGYTEIGLDDTAINPCVYYLEFRGVHNIPNSSDTLLFEHQAFIHVESGIYRIRNTNNYLHYPQQATYPDFKEPKSFDELKENVKGVSWRTFTAGVGGNYAAGVGSFFMNRRGSYYDWHTFINDWNCNLNLIPLWFDDYDKYKTALNNIAKNSVITNEMLDGGTPIVGVEYDTIFYRKYQSVNYSVKNREYTCYVKANEENKEKAWLLLCYIKSINTIVWLHSINPSLDLTTDATVKYEWNGLIFDQTVNEYPDIDEISDFNNYKGYISKYTLTKIPVEWKQSEYKLINGKYTFKKHDNITKLSDLQWGWIIDSIDKLGVVNNLENYFFVNDIGSNLIEFTDTNQFISWYNGNESIVPNDITPSTPDNPQPPTPPTDDKSDMVNPNNIIVPTANMVKYYVLNSGDLQSIGAYLWNSDDSIYNAIIKDLELMGSNPLDAIISVKAYPLDITKFNTLSPATFNIQIGRATVGDLKAHTIIQTKPLIDVCSFTIDRNYNDFMDFAPYTTYSIYLPYVGIIPLDTQGIYGKTIKVQLAIDIITGGGQYIISIGDAPIRYEPCQIAVDISLSAIDNRERVNNIISALSGTATATLGASLLGGNPLAIASATVGGIANTAVSDVLSNNIKNSGQGGSILNFINPQQVYLIKSHVPYQEPSNYNIQYGYCCNRYGAISKIQGKVWVENPNLDIVPCTENERNELKELLESGVVY